FSLMALGVGLIVLGEDMMIGNTIKKRVPRPLDIFKAREEESETEDEEGNTYKQEETKNKEKRGAEDDDRS
ncbi:MAG: hypothetical protein ABEJ72_09345, partial [Candidatus Aenigmatarchaeota archaeon]